MPLIPNAYTPDTIAIGIIAACRRLSVDDLATVCAISCALVESNLKMYANDGDPHTKDYPYQAISFDKNSAGIYQQRAPWWDDPTTDDFGGSSDRMDVFRSTRMFINSLLKQRNPDYHSNAGVAIANVQRPREDLRWKYGARLDEAWGIFNRLKNSPAAPEPGVTPIPPPEPFASQKPQFTELERFGSGRSSRSRPIINFFLHTQEGPPGHEISNATAEDLAAFCQGQNGVSYHYTLRNRIVCDVVDTDYSSWSVLDANVFSINACFAGSSVKLTRQQWLEKYGPDIEIAAWLAVQDCRKYPSMSTLVIPPPYRVRAPGISDHKYVTQKLGIGTHSDVGPNFPWDVFERHVLRFNGNTNSGDEMTKEEHDKLFEVWGALFNTEPSVSPYAITGKDQWGNRQLIRNMDGMQHGLWTDHCAVIFGEPWAVKMVKEAAQLGSEHAILVWNRIPKEFKENVSV